MVLLHVPVPDGLDGLDIHNMAPFGFYPGLPGMFAPLRLARLTQDVSCQAIPTGPALCHVALYASGVAGDTGQFCALPWRLRHVADLER